MFLNEFKKIKANYSYSLIKVCICTWINRYNDTPGIKNDPQTNCLCVVNQHTVILIYDGTSTNSNFDIS